MDYCYKFLNCLNCIFKLLCTHHQWLHRWLFSFEIFQWIFEPWLITSKLNTTYLELSYIVYSLYLLQFLVEKSKHAELANSSSGNDKDPLLFSRTWKKNATCQFILIVVHASLIPFHKEIIINATFNLKYCTHCAFMGLDRWCTSIQGRFCIQVKPNHIHKVENDVKKYFDEHFLSYGAFFFRAK